MRKVIYIVIAALAVLIIAGGVAAVSYTHSDDYTSEAFPEGVTINGYDCSGLSYEDAVKGISDSWNGQKMIVVGNLDEKLAEQPAV